jgi:hypothetical protein
MSAMPMPHPAKANPSGMANIPIPSKMAVELKSYNKRMSVHDGRAANYAPFV